MVIARYHFNNENCKHPDMTISLCVVCKLICKFLSIEVFKFLPYSPHISSMIYVRVTHSGYDCKFVMQSSAISTSVKYSYYCLFRVT